MSHPTPLPPEPEFQQQFGRSRGLLLGPAVVVAAIVLWVGAVQLGSAPPAPTPRPDASAPVAAGSPTATGSPAPSLPPPMLQLFGPAPADVVLIRERALREVDLSTGALGDPVGESGYLDRMLALPDGGYVCICVRQRTRGEERQNEVDILVSRRSGDETVTVDVGTWVGTDLPGLHQEPGPFSIDAAHSPDGRYVAITTSLRRPPDWLREVVLIDLEAAKVRMRLELPPTPSAQQPRGTPGASPAAGDPRWAWAPIPRFSPDGARLLLVSVEVDNPDGLVTHRAQVLHLEGGPTARVVDLAEAPDPTETLVDGACEEAVPQWASDDLVVTLCYGDPYVGPFLRRDRPDGTRMRRISLRDPLKDAAAPALLTDGRGDVWLWDAWSTRAVRVNAEDGVVEATAAMPSPGQPDRFVSPSAALTPDGRRLLVAVSGPGETGGTIHVLDARTFERVSEWAAEPGLTSIAVSPDGRWLYLAHGPDEDASGAVRAPARMLVIEIATGTLRARLGRLGDHAFSLVDRGTQED